MREANKRALVLEVPGARALDSVIESLAGQPGLVFLRGGFCEAAHSRYSLLTARPFLTFRSWGSRCELRTRTERLLQFGNPWRRLEELLARYELRQKLELPLPLGGCFGYWGYELKNFLEPKLARAAGKNLDTPDCWLGFYSSLIGFDHALGQTWVISTGLGPDGGYVESRARAEAEAWQELLLTRTSQIRFNQAEEPEMTDDFEGEATPAQRHAHRIEGVPEPVRSNLGRSEFLARVERARAYIRSGEIYQVNLSQRLAAPYTGTGWELFQRLKTVSPAPFAAYLDCGDHQIASSSPELFLRLSGSLAQTRPIKGTRPRAKDTRRDAQLADALQTSLKERAELVMITDLLRNDLGKICEYGSVHVPKLASLERYSQVQHLVSTVEGRLRPGLSHLEALAACFPGGSITGAPKFRAMEIIDALEPAARGPYTGALGYLGFNRQSQLSMIIRTALLKAGTAYFPVGAGIVADSDPEAEYTETLDKAAGFFAALGIQPLPEREPDPPVLTNPVTTLVCFRSAQATQ